MKISKVKIFYFLLLMILGSSCEYIYFYNEQPNESIGVLVDGMRGGVFQNDETHFVNSAYNSPTLLRINEFQENLNPGEPDALNDIIAFQAWNVPVLKTIRWNKESYNVTFPQRPKIEFVIHILQGPFEDMQERALLNIVEAMERYCRERMCFDIGGIDFNDYTNHPNRSQFLTLDTSDEEITLLKNTIGFVNNKLNIYYVDAVDFGSGPGTGNGFVNNEIVAMGRTTGGGLFAHELGHTFSLGHIDNDPVHFDGTNIMLSIGGGTREYLTEGQVFRAYFKPSSLVHIFQNTTTRNCPSDDIPTKDCPEIQKRLWADGPSWPPN